MIIRLEHPVVPEGVTITYDAKFGPLTPDDDEALQSALDFANKVRVVETNALLELVATYAQQYAGLGTDGEVAAWRRVNEIVFKLLTPENQLAYLQAFPDSMMAKIARGEHV